MLASTDDDNGKRCDKCGKALSLRWDDPTYFNDCARCRVKSSEAERERHYMEAQSLEATRRESPAMKPTAGNRYEARGLRPPEASPDVTNFISQPPPNDFPMGPETLSVSKMFVDAAARLAAGDCAYCGGSGECCEEGEKLWRSPEVATEATYSFNFYQTALLNTAVEGTARMLNRPELRDNPQQALAELCRVFLQTDPVLMATVYANRPARVDRGKINDADWVVASPEVVETPSDAPPALSGDIISADDDLDTGLYVASDRGDLHVAPSEREE